MIYLCWLGKKVGNIVALVKVKNNFVVVSNILKSFCDV